MPRPALTPQLALDHLGELSSEVRAALLLDERGDLAAHTADESDRGERLGALVRELLERADAASEGPGARVAQVEVTTPEGAVFALRAPAANGGSAGWTIAVVAERLALPSLMFYDLLHVLARLQPEAA